MPRIRNESVNELLHLAVAGYNSLIAELEDRRAQLAAMLIGKTRNSSVKIVAPKKRSKLSAAARAKISAAQKARWAKDRKEKTEEQMRKAAQSKTKAVKSTTIPVKKKVKAQTPKAKPLKAKLIKAALIPVKAKTERQTPRAASSTVRPVKAALAPTKSKLSPVEKTKPTKINFARETLAQQGQKTKTPHTSKPDVVTPAEIVEQMALAGARFSITRGGSLVIGNLGSLPPAVQRMFLDHPAPHLLTAAARRHLAAANQSSKQ